MTWVVLIPSPLGFCLFVRWPRQRLRTSSAILHPADLRGAVASVGDPVTAVLVGRRATAVVAEAILPIGGLVIVPEAWLRGVPAHALSRRAAIALSVASAYRAGPVEHHLRDDGQLSLF
jgi:hypothetical protein